MENKKKGNSVVWRIVLSIIFAAIVLMGVKTTALSFFGTKTQAEVTSISQSRSKNSRKSGSYDYTNTVGYKFTVNGESYIGTDTYKTKSVLVKNGNGIEEKQFKAILYFPRFPQISCLHADNKAVGGIVMIVIGILLLILINYQKFNKKESKITSSQNEESNDKGLKDGERITMAWLNKNSEGHDEYVDRYYSEGWDKDDPSWKCVCGEVNDGRFCEKCGKEKEEGAVK